MRPTIAKININNFIYNIKILKARCKGKLLVAVKANAYGHGANIIASACEQEGVDFLGVATIEEGIALRENAIDMPILVIGATLPSELDKISVYDLSVTIFSIEQLEAIYALKTKVKIHLKIDTGMGRLGILPKNLEKFLFEIKRHDKIILEGISTHLAIADEEKGKKYTDEQLDIFQKCIKTVKTFGLKPIIHFANSAKTFDVNSNFSYDEDFTYMNRVGISAYGYSYVDTKPSKLKKVLTLESKIAHIKRIEKGQCVSYGCEFTAKKPTIVATVPIGYADGYKRSYKHGYMLVNGKKAKIIGRICMDHTMLDVTDIRGVEVGDIVTCIGNNGSLCITADDLAKIDGTINYEVLTSISERVKRIEE